MKQGLIVMSILIILFTCAYDTHAETYVFFETSTGRYFDMNRDGPEPDGDFIAKFRAGIKKIDGNNIYSLYGEHRSNFDIGWPRKNEYGADEYHRNGIFISFEKRFRLN